MNVCRYFAPYRYRPPMPLEDVSNNYFYCMPGGLPPLAPRKKKKVTIIVINDKTDNKNNNNNNNNLIINIPPTTTPVIVPTVTTAVTPTTLPTAPYTPLWGWTVYYWFIHTFPRWCKFFGLIYLFLVYFFTGKDCRRHNNINFVIDHPVEDEDEEDEDEWIHGVSHTNFNYDYYDDEVPIVDEVAPPEAEELSDFVALRSPLQPQQQQEVEPIATSSVIATTIVEAPYYDVEDEDEDDDGSDYYFSLPSENAINSFIAVGVAEGEAGEDANFGMAEEPLAMEIEDIMPVLEAFDATEDVVEATIATDDATEDVEAWTSIDGVAITEVIPSYEATTTTASLGSIWVPDPKHGLVRRSARLRVRG